MEYMCPGIKRSLLVGIICLITGLTKAGNNDDIIFQCPTGWTSSNYMCYKAVNKPVPWDIARDYCKSMQSELVKITDYWFGKEVGAIASKQGLTEYWIGFTLLNAKSTKTAHWSNGEESNTKRGFWADYNPPRTENGKCSYEVQTDNGPKWVLGHCDDKKPFVCEKTACTVGTFMCGNSRCIGMKQICDGKDDCRDGTDEQNCQDKCRFYLTGSNGILSTVNYPQKYPANSFCLWKIQSDIGTSIQLTFSEFLTERNTDVVEIFVGSLSESEAFLKYRLSGNKVTKKPYTSPNNMMIIKFMSDSSTEDKGFSATWKSVSTSLKPVELRTLPSGNITVNGYKNNEHNTWTIRTVKRREIITLEKLEMHLLDKDEVVVFNGDSLTSPILANYNSKQLMKPQFIQSTGEAMMILLKTRGLFSNGRFTFSYKAGCQVEIKDQLYGEIISPGYDLGQEYPNSMECKWTINIPSNRSYSLQFNSTIEKPNDRFNIYNIINSKSSIIYNSTSAASTSAKLPISTGDVEITLKTNAIKNEKGFKVFFSIDCPDPIFNANTKPSSTKKTWNYGSSITVTCEPGYSFYSEEFAAKGSTNLSFVSETSVTMVCQEGGQWNVKSYPECLKNYCGSVDSIPNGRVLNATGVQVGDTVQYTCEDGYTIVGKDTVKCQESGQWEAVPNCTATGCTSPSSINNGQKNISAGSGTDVGSIVRYTCDSGYQIDGVPISQCNKSGQWSSNPPSCKILVCSALGLDIPNAGIVPSGDVEFKKTKTVTCDPGFNLNGTSTIHCLADQSFSTLPTCEDINECDPGSTLNKCTQICKNTPGSYYCECKVGYKMNADNITCEDIKECATNNGDCEQMCKDTDGSYGCSCKEGYALYVGNYTMYYALPVGDDGRSSGDVFYLNHSCVPVLCPDVGILANGYIQPQRDFSHFGDTFYFSCKIGFKLKGDSKIVCMKNGNWSSTLPTCEAIKCPMNGKRKHPDVAYLDYYNFTCEVAGKPKEYRTRQCLYDPTKNTYSLLGDSYDCKEIDCGQPKPIPGAIALNVANTTYGSQYEINCTHLYRLKGNSSYGNTIQCGSDGKWDYGDLKCYGVTCDYPSVSPEVTVQVTGFTEGSTATYNCTKKGYAPSNSNNNRTCVKNSNNTGLVWDRNMTTCIDVQPPTVKDGNCDRVVTLDKYSELNVSIPEFDDNSGVFTVEIEPKEAITGFIVTQNMTIVYTAKDKKGNNFSCSIEIVVEDRPLKIECPANMVEELENSTHTKTIAFKESMVTVTGPGTGHKITFKPTELNINKTDTVHMITVEATHRKKTAKCTFVVTVQAKACSALSRPQVQHAIWTSDGNTTEFKCPKNYSYPDNILGNVMKTQCNSSWDIPYTSCSVLENFARYYANNTFNYKFKGKLSGPCAKELQSALIGKIQGESSKLCITLNGKPDPTPIDSTFKYTITGSTIAFNGLSENRVKAPIATFTEKHCLGQYKEQLGSSNFILYDKLKSLTSSCGDVTFDTISTDIFAECNSTSTKVDQNGYTYCVDCPPGTYYDLSKGNVTCELCPIGEYQDTKHMPSCMKCPEKTSTYFLGGYSKDMCKAKCPVGFYSPNGIPPCKSCPDNTYSKNATYCEACPANTKGFEIAATSSASCKAKCLPGSYSFNAYEPCHPCPKGFYSSQEMQTECMECDDNTTTKITGSDAKSKCIDVVQVLCKPTPCKDGRCLPLGHQITCKCDPGFTGDLCEKAVDTCSPNPCYYGGQCSKDGKGYKCDCKPGTNGKSCEQIIPNCKNGTCQQHGICRNIINGTECICDTGYDGEFCEKLVKPCDKKPCINGTCTNLGTDNYKCDCTAGYNGENCERQIDNCASSPCLFNSTCINLVNDFSCKCISGYSDKTCSQRSDVCSNANCSMGICVPNIPRKSYTCSCNVGYKYDELCQFSMKTSNGTDNSSYDTSENVSSKDCISKCSADTQCKAAAFDKTKNACYYYKSETDACCTVFTKECMEPADNFWTPWYTITNSVEPSAVLTTLKSIGIDVCDGKLTSVTQCKSEKQVDDKMRPDKYAMSLSLTTPCLVDDLNCKKGDEKECSMYRIRFRCAVSEVMQNNQCKKKSKCHDISCENSGTCIPLHGTCACPITYNPPFCRTPRDHCSGTECGNGTCVVDTNKAVCNCDDGFEGPSCTEIDECKNKPCDTSGASACQDLINGYTCTCKAGFKGKNCSENINECLSNPCLHQGTCTEKVNDFTCTCTDGWTGKRCEKPVDHCTPNKCANNGECFNLFKTYYCRCRENAYGLNCSKSVSICDDANPCLNAANCIDIGGKAQCTCKPGFTGSGCQIAVDFCKSPRCANGGTCIAKNNGYECQCPTGFKGAECKQMTHDCTTSRQTCQEPMPTECPIGSQCNKVIPKDYDLDFYLSEKNGIATMDPAINVSETDLSINLWVRFKEIDGQGTFFNLFMIKSTGITEEKIPVLRISDEGITYTTSQGNVHTAKIENSKINDGNWHQLTLVIYSSGNKIDFRRDAFLQSSPTPIMNFFKQNCVVILGCYYDAKLNMPVVNKGFYGEISQATIYSKSLVKDDIGKLVGDPQADLGDILVGWGNYQLVRGVRRISPSTVKVKKAGQTFINVKSCPQRVDNYGKQGRTLLQWEPPQFTDNSDTSKMKQNYRPGTTVLWGRYAVTFAAQDASGNVALCNFMVYAKEGNCTKPDDPYNGMTTCDAQEFPFYSCKISCNGGRALTAPAPELFTCGPEGCWYPEASYQPMRYPTCGKIKTSVISINLNLEYSIVSTDCKVVKQNMKPKLKKTMKDLNAQNGFILCAKKDCSDIEWNITCNDKLNAAQDIKINAKINVKDNTIIDILKEAVLDKGKFNYPTYGVGTDSTKFSLTKSLTCATGQALLKGQCVECSPGTYLNVSTQCDSCPVGTYQSTVAQTSCKPCPANQTTLTTGNMKAGDCKVKCPPGEFFNIRTNKCEKCDIFSYQDMEGKFICKPCLSGKSTKVEGAKAESECTETCPAGYEFTTNCTACQIGFYRENNTANTCKKCSSNMITLSTGSTSEQQCNISACYEGSYLNKDNNTCIQCPDGSYQDKKNQDTCKPCPGPRYRTGKSGAKKSEDCKFFCESGFEANKTSCRSCPKGTYKDNTEDFYGLCKTCPNSKTTLTINSTSVSQCTIHKCPAGQQPNAAQDGCDSCPLGTYQPEADQKECIACNANYSTRTNGSTDPKSCEVFCDSGYERVAGHTSKCKECGIGYIKDNSLGLLQACQPCANGKITEQTASISEKNCTKANCSAGQYLVPADNKCYDCEYGKYQDEKWKTTCIECPANYTTYIKGADKKSSCLLSCDSGYELVTKKCQSCAIGYYRNSSNNPGQLACSPCSDPNFVTEKEGAISEQQCTVANCSAGSFLLQSNNTCQECALNEYQNVSFQTKCLPCASGFKTWKTGSTACVRMCPAGEVAKNDVCTKCEIGYYRKTDTETCTKCPGDFLTKEVGAKDASSCVIPPCKAGNFYDGKICKKCPKDSFQDKQYQKSCKKCPGGKYTKTDGTTKEAECLSYCVTKTDNCTKNSTCKDDPAGYKCVCNNNFIADGNKCIHMCDTNHCQNGATCTRGVVANCVCTKYYDGPTCSRQLSAKEVSKNSTHSIIGAVIGVLAGLLILILIITYVCVRMRRTPSPTSPVQENGSFGGTLSTKFAPTYVPINSLPSQPILDHEGQISAYTNAAYDEDNDPAIFKT